MKIEQDLGHANESRQFKEDEVLIKTRYSRKNMIQDMNKTLTRLFTVALLMMVSLGAKADVKLLFGEKGTELQPAKNGTITLGQKELTGGTIIISQEDQKDGTSKVTFAVTPDKNYKLAENGLEVYAVIPTDISSTRGLEVSTTLTLKSEDFKDEASKRTYTATIDSKLALWIKSADFLPQNRDGAKASGDPEVPSIPGISGLYYIANNNTNSYVQGASTNWYMVPASNGGDSSVGVENWTWNNDEATPLVTTFQTQNDDNSVWAVVKNGDNNNYYFIHVLSGKYMTLNDGVGTNKNRRTFHMEATNTGDNALFTFTSHSNNTFYSIKPKNKTTGHMYLNPSNGNKPTYYASATTDGNYTVGGTIGLYNTDATGDAGSKWLNHYLRLLSNMTLITKNLPSVMPKYLLVLIFSIPQTTVIQP